MSVENDIARIKLQEQRLHFKSLTEAEAWELGALMRAKAASRNLPFVIDIRTGIRPLFYAAMPGSTPENPDWVRRKINTVYRFDAASYRVALEYQARGAAFDATRGLDLLTYAPAGGGFPIRISGIVVGVVTVSGVPQREDHNFVVECLAEFLNVPHADVQLDPESP